MSRQAGTYPSLQYHWDQYRQTNSVDVKTDAQMQKIIRSEFKNHTIIMIAHRLDSLLDFDRVAVLNKGNLVEFDKPSVLLEKEGSAFSKLYHASS